MPPKSRGHLSQPSFDPLIVEDTAEIDRAVEAGHVDLNNVPPVQSRIPQGHHRDDDTISHPESEDSSFRRSEPPTPPTRLKLSAALERVADDHFAPLSPRRAFSPTASPRLRSRASPPRTASSPGPQASRREPFAWDEANARAQRHPLVDIVNKKVGGEAPQPPKRSSTMPAKMSKPIKRVELPDLTGLTAAVESPVKQRLSYYDASASESEPGDSLAI